MKKNNILFIIDSLETLAGTEKQLLYMTAKLNSEDYSCLVCPLLPENSSAIQKFREVGIEVLPLAIERLYSIAAFKKLYMLKRIIKQRRIKIIQTFHFGSDVFGVFLAKLTSVPILISNRRDMGFTESRGYFRFVRRVINHAITRIISVSQNLQHYIAITERVNKRKLLTIYNGVDLEKYPKSVDSISKKIPDPAKSSSVVLKVSQKKLLQIKNDYPVHSTYPKVKKSRLVSCMKSWTNTTSILLIL